MPIASVFDHRTAASASMSTAAPSYLKMYGGWSRRP
jgi:hypothetical protein